MATNRGDDSPFVSVVMPIRNERTHIDGALAGIFAQDYPPDRLEIVVADGESDDGTRDLLESLAGSKPHLRIVENRGRIASTGLNAAISAARGEILVRADAHSTYAPDYIRACVETLQATGADNVGGPARTKPADSSGWGAAISSAYHSPFSVGGARFHDVEYEGRADTVTYGCWPRKTFERFGMFDGELVRNQDDEHNLRIVRGGGLVYQSPRIRSWYQPRSSLRTLFSQYSQYGYWKVRVIQKHKLPASPRHVAPIAFVTGLAVGAVLAPLSRAFAVAYLAALVVYTVLSVAFSIAAARRSSWKLLPRLPLVFLTYHVAYGWGFLRGVIDFVILRRSGRSTMTTLSRPTAPGGPV